MIADGDELHCRYHIDSPAAVITVHGSDRIGLGLCAGCATCSDTRCGEQATILDTEHNEPWCAPHAADFTGQDTVHGPELVAVDSDRHRALAAQRGNG